MTPIENIFKKYKTIKKKKTEEHSADEKAVIDFVSHIKEFYEFYDIHEKTKHAEIFELLFLNKRKLSSENISQKMFISVKTLYRFKIQYLTFIAALLQSGAFNNIFGQILTEIS